MWIENIINHHNGYRVYFEPFHPGNVAEFSFFKNRQYFRDEVSGLEFVNPLNFLMQGKLKNKWIDSRDKNFYARKLLIKDIRANLLLNWIKCHHPDIKIILLLRHPCAVAQSRIKLGWGGSIDHFLNQPELLEDHLNPFIQTIRAAEGDLQVCVTAWCIENYIPLKQFKPGEIHVCFYENFLLEPAIEIRKLMDFIGDPLPDNLDPIINQSSDTNWNRAEHSGQQVHSFNQWKEDISPGDYKIVKNIMIQFGMDQLYDDDGYPLSPELRR